MEPLTICLRCITRIYGIGPYLFYIRLTNNVGLDINLSDTLIRLK